MRKKIMIITTVCVIMITAMTNACAGVMEDIRTFMLMEEPVSWSMSAGMILQAYPAFGEKRMEQFNRLIRHLQLKMQKQADQAATVQIFVSGSEAACFTVNTEQQVLSAAKTRQALTVFDLLDTGADFLRDLPEKIPEACTEKIIKQKLKKGVAVRSVTITAAPVEEGVHPLTELISKDDHFILQSMFGSWIFQGKQKFTLLYDEEGRLLKVNYTGRSGEAADRIRNIRLEWRIYRTKGNIWDELTLRTPTVEGADRDNWVLNRNQTVNDEGETLTFSFEYDQKTGNDKTGYRWDGNLQGSTGLSGEISYSATIKNETDKMIFRPDLSLCNQKQIAGALEIIHVSSKIEKEHFTLQLDWNAEDTDDIKRPDAVSLTSGFQDAMKRETVSTLLRSILINVPEKDLGYLKEGISDTDWNCIMEAACSTDEVR
ncbi:MAG: hypothetical protein IJK38_05130 [Oscillospiraceae bacterium]|nr:hypothetical protein [Oscillospiraceae bacterium]